MFAQLKLNISQIFIRYSMNLFLDTLFVYPNVSHKKIFESNPFNPKRIYDRLCPCTYFSSFLTVNRETNSKKLYIENLVGYCQVIPSFRLCSVSVCNHNIRELYLVFIPRFQHENVLKGFVVVSAAIYNKRCGSF